jgi:hypothetical protein
MLNAEKCAAAFLAQTAIRDSLKVLGAITAMLSHPKKYLTRITRY